MSGSVSSPSLSRFSGKEWIHKAHEEKNEFFRKVIEESKMKVKGKEKEKAVLNRTMSQSSLNSSSSSLVEMSEGEMALVAAAAQLASGGRIKRQSSIRALINADKKVDSTSKPIDASEIPPYETDALFFQEEEGRLKVQRASPTALMYLLLDPRGCDFDFETTFFLTFPLFTSADHILGTVEKWLCGEVGSEGGGSSSSHLSSRSDAVKEKVRDSLSHWVHLVPEEFLGEQGQALLARTNAIVSSLSLPPLIPIPPSSSQQFAAPHADGSPSALHLSTDDLSDMLRGRKRSLTLKKKGKKEGTEKLKRKVSLPSLPSSGFASSILLWPPSLLAQQLTAMSWFWFERIGAREWLSSSWGAKDMDEAAVPSIFNLVIEFNYTHLWAVSEVLSPEDECERAQVLERLIDALAECVHMQNYQSALALFCALSSTAVDRLSRTWKGVSPKAAKSFRVSADLLKMDGNFAALRSVVYSAPPPLLPYVGLPMGDLTAIQQIALRTEEGDVVFEQCDVMGRVIAHIRHCQATPYPYKIMPEFVALRGRRRVLDEKEAFALSQEREAGERKGGGEAKDVKTIGSGSVERRKSIASSSLFSSSPVRSSGLKLFSSDPSIALEEGGEVERGNKKVDEEVFRRNPYSSRFTEEQLGVLANFVKNLRGGREKEEDRGEEVLSYLIKSRKRDATKEEIEGLKKDLGPRGAGGVLLSTHTIVNWLNGE